jgi:hypothetical protein
MAFTSEGLADSAGQGRVELKFLSFGMDDDRERELDRLVMASGMARLCGGQVEVLDGSAQ